MPDADGRVICGLSRLENAGYATNAVKPAARGARQQWRNLRRLSVAAEPLFGRTVENPRPFSPLDFQAPPLRLLHWQPSAQGGEMALKTSWDAVPSLFVRLAESEMSVSRFSLRREGAELLITLQLERLANEG